MEKLRLKLPNQDRVGLVLDVSRVLANQNINIISMEVTANVMYLEIESLPPDRKQLLKEQLAAIPQVNDVIEIPLMPHQWRERQIKAVLDSVSEGILAIDQNKTITHFNPAAEKIIHYTAAEVLGQNLEEFFPPGVPILNTLQNGSVYTNKEIILNNLRGRCHYMTSGRPIRDEKGQIIGAVAVLKDMSDVRELVYSLTQSRMITFDDIIFASDAMQRVVDLAKLVAKNDSTVLIRGESGTGKELFARAIHMASARSKKSFVPINCAALPDTLLESELFGYEEGAFTGAKKGGKPGLFEFASGGTLFLDEVGEISPHLQAKLLRVLQEGKVRRIGGNEEIAVNVRVIAATNKNLEAEIRRGTFRDDLYYRLNVIPLHIPPLRERKEDIPIIVHHLLAKFNYRLKKDIRSVSESAMRKLLKHDWSGNVRELENVIERAANLAGDNEITADHIMLDQEYVPANKIHIDKTPRKLKDILGQVEKEVLAEAIDKYGTSREIGKILGVSHTAVLNKLRKYRLREKSLEN